jgi:FMN phosphatase YigB (HAD superfamily)
MEQINLKAVEAVLFDLDGTLLQVEMGEFIPAYIGGLAAHCADLAEPGAFGRAVRGAISALIANDDGSRSNEALFQAALERHLGITPVLFAERLARFCADGLADLAPLIRPLPLARNILTRCRERGLAVVVATNPVFPRPVIEARLAWGGLAGFPFRHITTCENSRFCKPNPRYFTDLLESLRLAPHQALMVGNDTEHDLAARPAGIPTFLVDTWLVDRLGGAFAADFRGGHLDLFRFLGQVGAPAPTN